MKKFKLLTCILIAIMATSLLLACNPDQSSTPTGGTSSNSEQNGSSDSSNVSTPEEYALKLYVDGELYREEQVEEGAELNLPTPEKQSHTFNGWYKDEALTQSYTASVMPSANLTLYGEFEAIAGDTVSVTYEYCKTSQTKTQAKGSVLTDETANKIEAIIEDGDYVFVNWLTENGEEYDFGSEITEDITLVANYYSDGLEVNGGIVEMYEGKSTDVIVPAKIGETQITGIGDWAFMNMRKITSIYVSEGISSIGELAFADCSLLTDVYLPTTIEFIGIEAFSGSAKLSEGGIHFEGNETYPVENGLVYSDSTKTEIMLYVGQKGASVEIPSTVTSIAERAFENMNLGSVVIPESVTSIGAKAFTGSKITAVKYLTSLAIPESCFKNCVDLEEIEIGADVISIGADAFNGCSSLENIEFPANLKEIGTRAFYGCLNLHSVELPSSYISFTGSEFEGAGIEYFDVPSYLTEIPENMFAGWSYLKEITIPEGITKINNGAFMGCSSLVSIKIPSSVKSIGRPADTSKNESSLIYNQTGSMVFGNCTSLTNVDMSEATGLEYIGPRSFFGCTSLEYFEVPENVMILDEGALAGLSNLKHIKLPFIGRQSQKAYQFEILEAVVNVAILYNLIDYTYTGEETAEELLALARKLDDSGRAMVGSSAYLTDYGRKLFNNASYYFGTQEEYDEFIATPEGCADKKAVLGYIFGAYTYAGAVEVKQYYGASADSGSSGVTYYIPNSLKVLEIYKTTTLASYALSNIQNVPELRTTSVKRLGARSYYLTGIKEFTLPETVTEIGEACFALAMQLTTLTVPDNVTVVGKEAFSYCIELQTAKLPYSQNLHVGAYAFRGCKKLNLVYQTSDYANNTSGVYLETGFYGNALLMETNVTYIFVGEEVIFVLSEGSYDQMGGIFTSCTSLISVDVQNDFKCLLSVDVPDLGYAGDVVSMIPGSLFSHCTSLTTINGKSAFEIPQGITHINSWAFAFCSIKTVIFPESVTYIGRSAFYESSISGVVDIRYVDRIGVGVFNSAAKVTKIIWNKNLEFDPDVTGEGMFQDCVMLSTFAIYDEQRDEIIEDEEGVAYIPSIETTPRYFLKKTAIEKVVFIDPEKLTAFELQFAYGCTSLQEITIPENVTAIPNTAFYGCTSLKTIIFEGDKLRTINANAFENCSALTEVVIPEGVVDMSGASIFRGCTNLVRISLPSTLRELPSNSAFRDCTSLKEIVMLASYPVEVDGGLMSHSSMLQMGEVTAEAMIDELVAKGLSIYVPADSIELYKSHYSTYGGFLREKTGWNVYSNAIKPLYNGVYTDGTNVISINQTFSDKATVTTASGSEEATVTYGDTVTFATANTTYSVAGNALTYVNGSENLTLYRISGVYVDQSAKYDLNDNTKAQYYAEKNALGETVKYEAVDWMQARKLQFKNQLHLYNDGTVEIWEFKESQAFVSESYIYVDGKLQNTYFTIYPPTVYEGTWTIENGQIKMVFNGVTEYKTTVSGAVNDNYSVIVEFTVVRDIASILSNGVSVAQNESVSNLASDYVYTRMN